MVDAKTQRRPLRMRILSGVLAMAVALAGIFGYNTKEETAPEAEAVAATLATITAALTVAKNAKDLICGTDSEDDVRTCADKVFKGDDDDVKDAIAKCHKKHGDDGEKLDKCIEEALEDEEEEETDQMQRQELFNFYRMQSALAAFYGNQRTGVSTGGGADKEEEEESTIPTTPGEVVDEVVARATGNEDVDKSFRDTWGVVLDNPANAGIFVGYDDHHTFWEDQSSGAWGGNQTAGANAVYNHSVMTPAVTPEGIYSYMLFGATLHGLGLDQVSGTGNNQGISDGAGRFVMGSTMLLAFILSGMIDVIFAVVLNILQILNPFSFLYKGVNSWNDTGYAKSLPNETPDTMDSLAELISDLYDAAINFGWHVTVPVSLGMFLIGALMFRRTDNWQRGKKVAFRAFFLAIGIPLVGVTYTGALVSMQGAATTSASANSSKVVLSNYVDYERWANEYRLTIPDGAKVTWDVAGHQPTQDSQAGVRRTAFLINTMINPNFAALFPNASQATESMSYANSTGYMTDAMTTGVRPGEDKKHGDIYTNKEERGAYTDTIDLLARYTKSQALSGAAYGSAATDWILSESKLDRATEEEKAEAEERTEEDENAGDMPLTWISEWNTVADLEGKTQEDILNNPLLIVRTGLKANIQGDKANPTTVSFSTDGDAIKSARAKQCGPGMVSMEQSAAVTTPTKALDKLGFGGIADMMDSIVNTFVKADGANGEMSNRITSCNLAPLAMYNYLNSSFNNHQVTVDSANRASSNNARSLHQAVTGVGAGAASVIYWFSAMSLLMSFVIIGVFYAFAMLFNCIKRSIQLILAVPFAMTGFMAGIAKVIVYSIVMILEIFGTLFIYRVVQEFLMVVPRMLEAPLIALFGQGEGSGFASLGALLGLASMFNENEVLVTLLITLVATGGIIIFTLMALRLRSSLISAMDEAATRVVNKFLDTNVSGGSEGAGGTMASLAGRTATMAMMYNGMGGGDNDDAGVATGPDGENIDPDSANDAGNTGGDGDGDGDGGRNRSLFSGRSAKNLGMALPPLLAGGYGAEKLADMMGGADEGIETMAQNTDTGGDVDGADFVPASLQTSDGPVTPDELQGNALQTADGGYLQDADGNAVADGDVADVNEAGNLIDHNGNEILDAQGNPIAGSDYYGDDATIASAAERNADAADGLASRTDIRGNLTDEHGNTMLDSNGAPIAADNVAGVNEAGNLIDAQGNEITDAQGNPIAGDDFGMGANTTVGDSVASGPMSDQDLAQRVQEQGQLSEPAAFEAVSAETSHVMPGGDDNVATGTPDQAGELVTAGVGQSEAVATGASDVAGGEKQLGSLESEGLATEPQTVGEAIAQGRDEIQGMASGAAHAFAHAGETMSAEGGAVDANQLADMNDATRAASTGVPESAIAQAGADVAGQQASLDAFNAPEAIAQGNNPLAQAGAQAAESMQSSLAGQAEAAGYASVQQAQADNFAQAGGTQAVMAQVARDSGLASGGMNTAAAAALGAAGMMAAGNGAGNAVPAATGGSEPSAPRVEYPSERGSAQPSQQPQRDYTPPQATPASPATPVTQASAGSTGGASSNPMGDMMRAQIAGQVVTGMVNRAAPNRSSVFHEATKSPAQGAPAGNKQQQHRQSAVGTIADGVMRGGMRNVRYNAMSQQAAQQAGQRDDSRARGDRGRDDRERDGDDQQSRSLREGAMPRSGRDPLGRSPGEQGGPQGSGPGTVNV